jgi:hypothetical protein
VETGEPAFRHVFGMDSFDYMAQHPDEAANFDAAMADFTKHIATAVFAAYDFSPFRRIVDVGAGNGALLAGILKANPALAGVLFDLPRRASTRRASINRTIAEVPPLMTSICLSAPADASALKLSSEAL